MWGVRTLELAGDTVNFDGRKSRDQSHLIRTNQPFDRGVTEGSIAVWYDTFGRRDFLQMTLESALPRKWICFLSLARVARKHRLKTFFLAPCIIVTLSAG
jgi:hypothetical protein